jgi:hypothetical protein
MKWTLIQMPTFKNLWNAERLPDEDLQALESAIMRDPAGSPVMRGTGGLRKIRFAPLSRGKGKSGSMRVGYAQFPDFGIILLMVLFLKKDEENLSQALRNRIRKTLDEFRQTLLSRGQS